MSTLPPASDVNDNDKLMAALAYFFTPLVPVIILVVDSMKIRPYQKYHALQSLGLFVAAMLFSVLTCICYFVGTIVSAGILGFCLWVIFFIPYIPFIYYTIIAYTRGEYFEIPVITKMMIQQGWLSRP
jgi:uncharacterized membrane protein